MNNQTALQILTNLANVCVNKGGIFVSVNEAATVNMALQVLNTSLADYEEMATTIENTKEDKPVGKQK